MRSHLYDIRLTSAEAVVLFELLHRLQESDAVPALDDVERSVAQNLLGLLEGALAERVEFGYADVVARAKVQLVSATR